MPKTSTGLEAFLSITSKILGLKKPRWFLYFPIGKYLEFVQSDASTRENAAVFRDSLTDKALSISTINNYCYAIKKYHEMLGDQIDFPFIRPKNAIPYFFDETDVGKIFAFVRI